MQKKSERNAIKCKNAKIAKILRKKGKKATNTKYAKNCKD